MIEKGLKSKVSHITPAPWRLVLTALTICCSQTIYIVVVLNAPTKGEEGLQTSDFRLQTSDFRGVECRKQP